MRYARLRIRLREALSPTHEAFLACEDLRCASLRYGGVGTSAPPTYLFEVAGDLAELDGALAATDGVAEWDLTPLAGPGGDEAYLYVRARTGDVEGRLRRLFTRASLVTIPPVGIDGHATQFHVVGRPSDLQASIADARETLPVTVERLGEYDRPSERETAALSERQYEALLAGLEVGYYDVPRRGTHEAVAERLDCAPSTASEHLRKAEATLVRELLG